MVSRSAWVTGSSRREKRSICSTSSSDASTRSCERVLTRPPRTGGHTKSAETKRTRTSGRSRDDEDERRAPGKPGDEASRRPFVVVGEPLEGPAGVFERRFEVGAALRPLRREGVIGVAPLEKRARTSKDAPCVWQVEDQATAGPDHAAQLRQREGEARRVFQNAG